MANDKQDDKGITEADIAESIDELEDLIAETKMPPKLYGEIPVLNDIVDPDEAKKYAQEESSTAATTAISPLKN